MNALRVHQPREQAIIEAAPFFEWQTPEGGLWSQFYRTGSGYLLRFRQMADFLVSDDGQDVECFPTPDVTDEVSRHLYLNQVRLLVLSKLGKLVLHAGAIEIDAGGVAFVGPSGAGKSTLTASFSTSGYRFLTDDGLVLEPAGDHAGYVMMPGQPAIRLWDDSSSALVGSSHSLSQPLPYTTKTRLLAAHEGGGAERGPAFCDQPCSLGALYFLGSEDTEAVSIRPLDKTEALVELTRSSFLLDVAEAQARASQFERLCRLIDATPSYRLDYPRRFDALAQVRAQVVEHALTGG